MIYNRFCHIGKASKAMNNNEKNCLIIIITTMETKFARVPMSLEA